jgi:hypothetical protein
MRQVRLLQRASWPGVPTGWTERKLIASRFQALIAATHKSGTNPPEALCHQRRVGPVAWPRGADAVITAE